MNIEVKDFGVADGKRINLFVMRNNSGIEVSMIDYGATIVSMITPDAKGRPDDIVLGFDDIDGYLKYPRYFGSTVGRVANRIGYAKFELNGKMVNLSPNNKGLHTLHGGFKGFDKVLWDTDVSEADNFVSVEFRYFSRDGEEGFPGNLNVKAVYSLTSDNRLVIEYHASTDKVTPVNITNHSYFNLCGQGNGTILDHELTINAAAYTPVDQLLITDGSIESVRETPFDFTSGKKISERLHMVDGGYDHNYCVDEPQSYRMMAKMTEPVNGRTLEVWSDQPGLQFYSGNFLSDIRGKGGACYDKYSGFCLEPQKYPDSVNKSNFPDMFVTPESDYCHRMGYVFGSV